MLHCRQSLLCRMLAVRHRRSPVRRRNIVTTSSRLESVDLPHAALVYVSSSALRHLSAVVVPKSNHNVQAQIRSFIRLPVDPLEFTVTVRKSSAAVENPKDIDMEQVKVSIADVTK